MGALLAIPAVLVGIAIVGALGVAIVSAVAGGTADAAKSAAGLPTAEELAEAKRVEEKRQAELRAIREAELKEEARPKTQEAALQHLKEVQAALKVVQAEEVAALHDAQSSGRGFQKVGEIRVELEKAQNLVKEAEGWLAMVKPNLAGGSGSNPPSKMAAPSEFTTPSSQSPASKMTSHTIRHSFSAVMPPTRQMMPPHIHPMPYKVFNPPTALSRVSSMPVARLTGPMAARKSLATALVTALRCV